MSAAARLGVRGRLLLVVLPLVATAIAATGVISIYNARKALTDVVDTNLRLRAENLADALGRTLSDSVNDVLITARLDLAAEVLESGDPKNFVWYADRLVTGRARYVAIVVADERGTIVSANRTDIHGKALTRSLLDVSLGTTPWRSQALAETGESPSIAGPLVVEALDGLPGALAGVIAISRPVIDVMDETIGTVTAFVSVASLRERLSAGETHALVVDKDGTPVVAPPEATAWRLPIGVDDFVSPEGAHYRLSEAAIGGAFASRQLRLVTTSNSETVQAPLRALTSRLLIGIIVALLLATALLALVAARMVAPILALTRGTQAATRAADFVSVQVERQDEIGALAGSFNRMMATIRSYESSMEEKVAERTRELEASRREVVEILDAIEQGIFTVDSRGLVNPTYSASCKRIFGDVPLPGRPMLEVLQVEASASDEALSRMRFWLSTVFGGDELQWIVSEGDGVSEVTYERPDGTRAALELEYAPIYVDGKIDKLMVVSKDVTLLRVLADQVRQKEEQNRTNLTRVAEIVALDPELFRTFISETEYIFQEARRALANLRSDPRSAADLASLFRSIHTLKGNARVFRLSTIQNAAHTLEEQLVTARSKGFVPDIDALELGVLGLETLRKEFSDSATRVLGPSSAEASSGVSDAKVLHVRKAAKELVRLLEREALAMQGLEEAKRELEQAVQGLTQVPLRELFSRYTKMLLDLAKELGRQVEDLHIVGADTTVDAKLGQLLRDAFLHALRNAVDHGIEPPEIRAAGGKPAKGKVTIDVTLAEGELRVCIHDDGRGIDLERVRKKGAELGFVTALQAAELDDSALIELLFLPGFSTAERVSEVSGRGVGMDVIRTTMRKLRGEARMRTTPGRGSTLELTLPADYYQQL